MRVNARRLVLCFGLLASAGLPVWLLRHDQPINNAAFADAGELESYRASGNLQHQRAHVWKLFAALVRAEPASVEPAFMSWPNKAEVFAQARPPPGGERLPFPGLSHGSSDASTARQSNHLTDAPLLTVIHYNGAAYRHLRQEHLFLDTQLQALQRTGPPDPTLAGMKTIPALPQDAVVAMSAWWPIAAQGITPMPIWDAGANIRASGSNGYVSWSRAVAIAPATAPGAEVAHAVAVEFAGKAFPAARRIDLNRLFHIPVNASMAVRLMDDAEAKKAALIALGRPLQAGDWLALVGLHLMTAELKDGIWGTFWWHDQPDTGPFASDRPDAVTGVWRNYLMDVAFDAVLPRGADGSPKICFNPWFDAKFPDGGQGNGVKSNCVNCHNRASYPRTDFLPVFRGPPDIQNDPAYAAGRLRTGQLWSLVPQNTAPIQ